MQTAGKVIALSVSSIRGVPKTPVAVARLREGWGIEGDAHAGSWHRQVSLLAIESIRGMQAAGAQVGPGSFAENVATEGIDLHRLRIGDRLWVGGALLEVTRIGKECHRACEIREKTGDCIMPREGIFARVIEGGTVRVGDMAQILDSD